MSLPLAQEVRRGADVVLVAVGEHQRLDVVEPVPDRVEVGEDQVDAGLVVLGEQHAAVDDQQPAVVLEDGHVATDLAETAERDDPQAPLRQLGRCGELGVRVTQVGFLVVEEAGGDEPGAQRGHLVVVERHQGRADVAVVEYAEELECCLGGGGSVVGDAHHGVDRGEQPREDREGAGVVAGEVGVDHRRGSGRRPRGRRRRRSRTPPWASQPRLPTSSPE